MGGRGKGEGRRGWAAHSEAGFESKELTCCVKKCFSINYYEMLARKNGNHMLGATLKHN